MSKADKDARRREAKKDYEAGMNYRQIAAKYGVTIGAITKWAKADGWGTSRSKQPKVNARPKVNKKVNTAGPEDDGPPGASSPSDEPDEAEEDNALEEVQEPEVRETDYWLLRDTALLLLEQINLRLQSGKLLEPREVKSLTGALLDLKNQLNALGPRELREQALRLQALRKQTEDESKPAEPVVVKFVNREWDDAGA